MKVGWGGFRHLDDSCLRPVGISAFCDPVPFRLFKLCLTELGLEGLDSTAGDAKNPALRSATFDCSRPMRTRYTLDAGVYISENSTGFFARHPQTTPHRKEHVLFTTKRNATQGWLIGGDGNTHVSVHLLLLTTVTPSRHWAQQPNPMYKLACSCTRVALLHFGDGCWWDPRPMVDSVVSHLTPTSVEFEQISWKEDFVQAFRSITSGRWCGRFWITDLRAFTGPHWSTSSTTSRAVCANIPTEASSSTLRMPHPSPPTPYSASTTRRRAALRDRTTSSSLVTWPDCMAGLTYVSVFEQLKAAEKIRGEGRYC